MGKRIFIGLAVLSGAAAITYRFLVLPWWRTWGINPEEVARVLPGDEVIPDAAGGETRAITVDAPPAGVWPWLVQMGYGRAGWYSYDAIDMAFPSTDRVLPEYQDLKVGDVVPTHPGGGFIVKRVEPDHALVLYLDSELVQQQAEEARLRGDEKSPANLRATGALMESTQPTEFAASWAFILEELPGGRTRLLERFRVTFGLTDKPWTRFTLPLMGFGVFVMVRKQLMGIKQRAERGVTGPKPEPIPV